MHTALPSDTGLVGTYRRATEAILLHISPRNLRRLVVSFEPGLGTPAYLSGARRQPPESPPPPSGPEHTMTEPEAEAEEPTWWSYGARRRTAMTLLGGSLEHVIAESGRARFAALRLLGVRVWDGVGEGKDDAWWLGEVSEALPTLHKLRLLRLEVMRDCEYYLWWWSRRTGGRHHAHSSGERLLGRTGPDVNDGSLWLDE